MKSRLYVITANYQLLPFERAMWLPIGQIKTILEVTLEPGGTPEIKSINIDPYRYGHYW